ncbi:hypothetical protein CSKR_113864 [Clonorchis sinensis]|uniref:Uncharacterized protein n=1 Tax=Clonorchis sinensis TaxID=79923 RepID=A0A419PV80_CLOSI|nr:hypothetical protein CSKR_113864 [Clonorchis sinensis]
MDKFTHHAEIRIFMGDRQKPCPNKAAASGRKQLKLHRSLTMSVARPSHVLNRAPLHTDLEATHLCAKGNLNNGLPTPPTLHLSVTTGRCGEYKTSAESVNAEKPRAFSYRESSEVCITLISGAIRDHTGFRFTVWDKVIKTGDHKREIQLGSKVNGRKRVSGATSCVPGDISVVEAPTRKSVVRNPAWAYRLPFRLGQTGSI